MPTNQLEVNGVTSALPQSDVTTRPVALNGYKDLLSVADLSKIFEISPQTVYKELKAGKFGKPLKFGRTYRIPKIYILQRYFSGF